MIDNLEDRDSHALPRVRPRSAGIVHLGLGAFHRAHQAVYTAAAATGASSPWGIVAVAHRNPHVVEAMRRQDFRYTCVELGPDATTSRRIQIHTEALVMARHPEQVVARIASPKTRIVTITATENGYSFVPGTQTLALTDSIRNDFTSARPVSVIGALAHALRIRHAGGGEPLAIVSCDNLIDNGSLTQGLVRQFIARTSWAEAKDLVEWMDAHVGFPNSMVDRVVPATTPRLIAQLRSAGHYDAVAVGAEPYSEWVLQDCFPGGRPEWEKVGVTFAEDISAYEQRKLRLVNAPHSLLAYLGIAFGMRTIADSMKVRRVEEAVRTFATHDMAPTCTMPQGPSSGQFIDAVVSRFANTALQHRCRQIGNDGSVKISQRVFPALSYHLEDGRVPHGAALLIAAFLSAVLETEADFSITDPHAREIRAAHAKRPDARHFIDSVWRIPGLLPESIAAQNGFRTVVVNYFERLRADPESALEAYLESISDKAGP